MNTVKLISTRTRLGRDVFHLYPETDIHLHIINRESATLGACFLVLLTFSFKEAILLDHSSHYSKGRKQTEQTEHG